MEKKENEIRSFFEFENEFKKKIDEFSTEIRAWIKILIEMIQSKSMDALISFNDNDGYIIYCKF